MHQLELFSTSGKPQIRALDDGAYPVVSVVDPSVYNTIQVNKNQRISSSIEAVMRWAKAQVIVAELRESDAARIIAGYVFDWSSLYRNFVNETNPSADNLELQVARDDFMAFLDGDLSAYELVQASILKVNGDKYTLTSWEPIGEAH